MPDKPRNPHKPDNLPEEPRHEPEAKDPPGLPDNQVAALAMRHAARMPARFHAQRIAFDLVSAEPEGKGTRVKYTEHGGTRTAEVVIAGDVAPRDGIAELAKRIARELHAEEHSDHAPADSRP